MIKIEFFHDAICSFCFPMSARMRRISKKYNNLDIIHRSFALAWEEESFIRDFGSREAVKPEVLNHWAAANKNDDEHRFNIEGMYKTDFNFPISKPALKVAKAAGLVAGEAMYWDVFDRIQHKLFVESKNIEDITVLEEAVKETNINFSDWKAKFEDNETEKAVLADLELAERYGINVVPTLIINEKYSLAGAVSQEEIESALDRIINSQ
ncbi:MAG: DsbA family protein [Clostridiales bacterium]|nr:DsbA family protein [Clostridiales bacterium]